MEITRFKIKVLRANTQKCWYNSYIGEEFNICSKYFNSQADLFLLTKRETTKLLGCEVTHKLCVPKSDAWLINVKKPQESSSVFFDQDYNGARKFYEHIKADERFNEVWFLDSSNWYSKGYWIEFKSPFNKPDFQGRIVDSCKDGVDSVGFANNFGGVLQPHIHEGNVDPELIKRFKEEWNKASNKHNSVFIPLIDYAKLNQEIKIEEDTENLRLNDFELKRKTASQKTVYLISRKNTFDLRELREAIKQSRLDGVFVQTTFDFGDRTRQKHLINNLVVYSDTIGDRDKKLSILANQLMKMITIQCIYFIDFQPNIKNELTFKPTC